MFTLADVKAYLGISGNTYDSFLTEQEAIISDAVEIYCRRKFNQANYVELQYVSDYSYGNEMVLYHYPVNSITTLKLDGVVLSNYRISQMGIITFPSGVFRPGCGEVYEITYNAGYATIPPIVKNAVMSLIQERYNKKVAGIELNMGSDIQRISIPGTISIDYDYSLQNNEEKSELGVLLGNYRNTLTPYMSERAVMGAGKVIYVS